MKMRIDQIEDEFAALDIVDEGDDVFGNSNIYAEAKPNTYAKNHRTKSYEERNHQFVLDMKKYYGKKIDAAQKKIPNLQKLPKINKNNSNFGFGGYIPTNPNLIINK